MKRALLGAGVVVAMMAFAAPAFAQTGSLEICKHSTGLSGTSSFAFGVSNGGGRVVVPNNRCSRPFPVTAGAVTVREAPGSFYRVSNINTSPGSALLAADLSTGTAVVNVPDNASGANTVVVNFTNVPVTGFIEVCKHNAADAGLTGGFTFSLTGRNSFARTVTVPVGHCSRPILVPAGLVTVTERAPNSITAITVANGSPFTTSRAGGTATVTVKPAPAPGDVSQEARVNFFNETVQLKVCKIASDAGVTAPYTFRVVGTGDPTFPAGITRSVTMSPGQCRLVPGPYTNPNGTTGWRAGTRVDVSEGVVAGTAVTAIAVTPANREVPGTRVLSPLPNPTAPGPAGSDAAILGAGETQFDFTNDSVRGGTLKICKVDHSAPAGTVFRFSVRSIAPLGVPTVAAVPSGSCTIVPNPAASPNGRFLYNSIVRITEVPIAGFPLVPPIRVSPAARNISQSGGRVDVSIGSNDITTVTYVNS